MQIASIMIGILNRSFIFLADLMRHVHIPCEVDFYKLNGYATKSVVRTGHRAQGVGCCH